MHKPTSVKSKPAHSEAEAYENSVTVASINFNAILGDKRTNLQKMEDFIIRAVNEGANIIVFPETSLTGLTLPVDMASSLAEKIPGPTTERIAELGAKYHVYVIFGMAERGNDGLIYDSAAVVGPTGILGAYRKVHPHPIREAWAHNGSEYPIFETSYGHIGIVICREMFLYPEVPRIYAIKGARLLINPTAARSFVNAKDTQDLMLSQLVARAQENWTFIVMANLVGTEATTQMVGYSVILGPKLNCMVHHIYAGPASGTEEEMLTATLDLSIVQHKPPPVATVFEDRQPRTYLPLVQS